MSFQSIFIPNPSVFVYLLIKVIDNLIDTLIQYKNYLNLPDKIKVRILKSSRILIKLFLAHRIRLCVLASFLLAEAKLDAQSCANYSVTRTTGITYSTISSSSPNSFIWRSLTGGATYDDNRSIFTPIGFDFWYLGIRYTNFSASTNGFIDFSTSTNNGSAGAAYGPLNGNEFSDGGTGGTMLALAPVYDDLWPAGQGAAPLATSYIYKTTGTAPNRVLTVEWLNMEKWKAAPYWATPPSLSFQVKIYESSGKIEFVYNTMTQGTATFDYACGINNFWTPAAAPTASQLLTQQTANTTSFSNSPANTLNTVPASSTMLVFTPPAPSASPSALSFSNIAKTSMELYWSDNASNELGYVVFNSTDNLNFNFVSQSPANSTSVAVSNLIPGTTYYWRLHAVTEGDLGSAATGTQATSATGTIISVVSGNWNTAATWNCTCVPTAGDEVTIANSHVVVVDNNIACKSLTVGQGTSGQLTIGNGGAARTISIQNDLSIASGGVVTISNNNAVHTMSVGGNITNNGTLNLSTTPNRVCNVVFNRDGNQTVSGGGGTTYFNRIIVNLGNSINNVLEINSTNFGIRPTNFLTLTNGTFKLSAPAGTINAFTAATTLSTSTAIWLNHATASLTAGNSITFSGFIRISAGTLTVGDAANENLLCYGGDLIVEGGALNVAGRFARNGLTSRVNFDLSAGQIVLGRVGSTTGGEAIFRIDEQGSSFSMSGGSISLIRPGASNLGFVNTSTTNVSVSDGTLFIADSGSPASQTITVNTNNPVQNLIIGSGVACTASLLTNSLTVNDQLSITSGSLIANNLPLVVGGNWTNNGGFTAGTSSVTFNGISAQSISGSATTTFNTLNVANTSTAGLTCSAPVVLSGSLLLNSGIVHTSTVNLLSLASTAGSTAGSAASHVDGPIEKTGTTAFVFPTGKNGRWARIGISAPSSSSTFRAEYFDTGFGDYTPAPVTPTPVLYNVSRVEYWNLDRVSGSGDAQVSLFWEDNTFSDIDDCSSSDLRVAHWNSGTSQWENNNDAVTTSGSCSGGTAGSVTTSLNVTGFSPFTFGSLSASVNPLPVELLEFSAWMNEKKESKLHWATATEKNSDYFDVQRSMDALNFENLGQVNASGNCQTKKEYGFTDFSPHAGLNYYRLKQVDLNGGFKYSKIISLLKEDDLSIDTYPNPSDETTLRLRVNHPNGEALDIRLFDLNGRELFRHGISLSHSKGSEITTLQLSPQFFPGVYTLNVADGKHNKNIKLVLLELK